MSIFDPEQHARPLSIAGTLCVVGGLYSGADIGWAVALAGVALLLAACYSRRDGFLLFGPFARADAVRSARSRRTHLVRAGIVLAAGAVIVLHGYDFLPRYVTQWSRTRQSTYANEQIVGWFAGSIAVLVPCLTVLLVSGAIAEERAAKRWEVLLTTDLRGRELVFGKLLGKLWLVVEPVVVILPVLAILPLIVGLSPALMLLFGGAVFVTVLALAGLSALFSSTAKARSGAAGVVVLLAFGYLGLSTGSMLLRDVPEVWTWPRFQGYDSPATVADLVEAFNAANPFTTLYIHGVARPTAGPPMVGYVAAFRQYSAGALGVFLVSTLLACQRVRSVRDPNPAKGFASRPIQLFGRGKPRETVQENQAKLRPPVTDEPLAWWANCRVGITGPTQRRKVAQVFAQMVAVFLSSYAIDLVGQVTLYPWLESIGLPVDDWAVSAGLLVLVSIVAPVVLTVALVAPVAAATRSIAAERRRHPRPAAAHPADRPRNAEPDTRRLPADEPRLGLGLVHPHGRSRRHRLLPTARCRCARAAGVGAGVAAGELRAVLLRVGEYSGAGGAQPDLRRRHLALLFAVPRDGRVPRHPGGDGTEPRDARDRR